NLNEKTKSNILSFLRKRIGKTASSAPKGVQGKTASRQRRNENKSCRELMKIIESKNFGMNIDEGVLKNREIF
ncbi:MAG: hypothetical protein SVO01_13495, partial [Thermotogota bacterium]|nr:hypothetical protein [Thermotogota bacterium]